MPATIPVTINPLLDTTSNAAYINLGNYVSPVKNHAISPKLSANDPLGVNQLGRSTGLALEQIMYGVQAHEAALRSSPGASISVAAIIAALGPFLSLFMEVALTVATTNIVPPSAPLTGQPLFVVLVQDGTGGRQITWDASFAGVTPNTLNAAANAVNAYTFIGRSNGKWQLAALPVLGQ